jgi:hypothetical protein
MTLFLTHSQIKQFQKNCDKRKENKTKKRAPSGFEPQASKQKVARFANYIIKAQSVENAPQ